MTELLALYIDRTREPSRAFWLGVSRLLNPLPLVTADVAQRVTEGFGSHTPDDWSTVASELREAIGVTEPRR